MPAPPTPPQRPPIEPELSAVLRPGAELRFARIAPPGDIYEVLPATSVILRFQNAYPGDPALIPVVLNWTGGSSGPLALVRSDDVARKQALSATGYYEVVLDAFAYYVIVTPPVAQRNGTGFNVVIRNRASNPPPGGLVESQPMTVKVRPVVARTDPSDVFFDCGNDHNDLEGSWFYDCQNSSSIVARHVVLEGWLVDPHPNCFSGLCWEDWHYDFVPNADFIEQIYGRGGMHAALGSSPILSAGAMLRGNPPEATTAGIGVNDVSVTDGSSRGITLNSFILPGNVLDGGGYWKAKMGAELNAWHPEKQGGVASRRWAARGAAPAGWMTVLVPTTDPEALAWKNARWPFDPRKPDGRVGNLAADNYVRLEGTLWQDTDHGTGPGDPNNPWSDFNKALGAWLEIHPVDWMIRVPPPKVRKTPALVHVINWDKDVEDQTVTYRIQPEQPNPSGFVKCREFIDGRYTDMRTVVSHSAAVVLDHVEVAVTVRRKYSPPNGKVAGPYPGVTPGRFKATYVVWWDPTGPADTTCR